MKGDHGEQVILISNDFFQTDRLKFKELQQHKQDEWANFIIAQSKLHNELDSIRKMERKTHLINEY